MNPGTSRRHHAGLAAILFCLSILPNQPAFAFSYDSTQPSNSIKCSIQDTYTISKDGYNESAVCIDGTTGKTTLSLQCDRGKIQYQSESLYDPNRPKGAQTLFNIQGSFSPGPQITLMCLKYVGLKVEQDQITQSIISNDRFEGDSRGGTLKIGLACKRIGYDVDTGRKVSESQATSLFNSTGCANHTVRWMVLPQGSARDSSRPANAADFPGNLWPSGWVKYVNGQYQGGITVQFKPNTVFEPNKNFVVMLTRATTDADTIPPPEKGTIFTNPALASSIINDDGDHPVFQMVLPDQPILEGDQGDTAVTLKVLRTGNLKTLTGVALRSEFDKGSGNADANDVKPLNELFIFNPGESEKDTTIYVHGDTIYEPDESFYIKGVSDFKNSTWVNENNRLKVTIKNDELQPRDGWGIYSETGSDTVSEYKDKYTKHYNYPDTIRLSVKNSLPLNTHLVFGIQIDGLSEAEIAGIQVAPREGFKVDGFQSHILGTTGNSTHIKVDSPLNVNQYDVGIRLKDDGKYEPDKQVTIRLVEEPGFIGTINHPSVSFNYIDTNTGWAISADSLSVKEGGQ